MESALMISPPTALAKRMDSPVLPTAVGPVRMTRGGFVPIAAKYASRLGEGPVPSAVGLASRLNEGAVPSVAEYASRLDEGAVPSAAGLASQLDKGYLPSAAGPDTMGSGDVMTRLPGAGWHTRPRPLSGQRASVPPLPPAESLMPVPSKSQWRNEPHKPGAGSSGCGS